MSGVVFIVTKHKELLASKHTQAILTLASVVSFSEKLRPYKGGEKLDRQSLESYIVIFGDKYPNVNMVRGNLAEVSEALALEDPQKLRECGSHAG